MNEQEITQQLDLTSRQLDLASKQARQIATVEGKLDALDQKLDDLQTAFNQFRIETDKTSIYQKGIIGAIIVQLMVRSVDPDAVRQAINSVLLIGGKH